MSSYATVMTEMLFFLFGFLSISLLSPRVLNLFLIKLEGSSQDRFTFVYVLTS